MSLPKLLCLTFATASAASGVDNIMTLGSFLPRYYQSTGAKDKNQKPIDTITPYLAVYAHLGARWHAPVHLGSWVCFAWSFVVHPESRTILSLAFACEIASMAVVPLILQPMREIDEAKTPQAAEEGLQRLVWRQILRNLFCHTPSMLLSLYSNLI